MHIKETFYGGIYLKKELYEKNSIKENIEIEYYKIRNVNEYGFELIKKEYKNNIIKLEVATVENFSYNEEKRNNMLNILAKNDVTPVSLEYILQDLKCNVEVNYSFK